MDTASQLQVCSQLAASIKPFLPSAREEEKGVAGSPHTFFRCVQFPFPGFPPPTLSAGGQNETQKTSRDVTNHIIKPAAKSSESSGSLLCNHPHTCTPVSCRPSLQPFAHRLRLVFLVFFSTQPSFLFSFYFPPRGGIEPFVPYTFFFFFYYALIISHSLVLFCAGRWKEDLRLFILHTCGLGCVALRCIRPPCILHPLDWHLSLIPSSGISILLVLASIFGLAAPVPRFSSRYLLVQSPTCTVTLRLHRSHHNRPPIAANPSRSARALTPTHQPRQANLDNWCIKRQTEG